MIGDACRWGRSRAPTPVGSGDEWRSRLLRPRSRGGRAFDRGGSAAWRRREPASEPAEETLPALSATVPLAVWRAARLNVWGAVERGGFDAAARAAVGERGVAVGGEGDGDAVLEPAAVAGEVRRARGARAVGAAGRRPVDHDGSRGGRVLRSSGRSTESRALDAVDPGAFVLAAACEGVAERSDVGGHGRPRFSWGVVVLQRVAEAEVRAAGRGRSSRA